MSAAHSNGLALSSYKSLDCLSPWCMIGFTHFPFKGILRISVTVTVILNGITPLVSPSAKNSFTSAAETVEGELLWSDSDSESLVERPLGKYELGKSLVYTSSLQILFDGDESVEADSVP